MYFRVMFLWSILLFNIALCYCECPRKEDKQRPTLLLKNAIEFYNTTIKLEEKVDSILLQLQGEYNTYEKIFHTPAMELRTSLLDMVEQLEKFKAQYKGDDFPFNDYNSFMESINKKFQETSALSNDIMPKFSEALEKIEEDKNSLFREISKFLTKRLMFDNHITKLEEAGILLHNPSENEEPPFDLSVLNDVFEESQTDTSDFSCNDDILHNFEAMSVSQVEQASKRDYKKLRNFVPTVNNNLRRIEEKIELIGEKYEDIFSRWLNLAEEVTSAEQKITSLREKLNSDFSANAKNEL